MKKIKIVLMIFLTIVLLSIVFMNFYGYKHIEKHVEMDNLEVNIYLHYRNIDSKFIFGLDPDIKNKIELEYHIKINEKEKEGESSDFGMDSIKIDNVYIIKNFENEDFSNYVIGAKYYDKKYGIMIIRLAEYIFIKNNNQGYFYESWYNDLIEILKSNNLNYTQDDLDSLIDNKTWNEIFASLPKK